MRRSGLGPRITGVTATPAVPAANQPVTVTATITGQTSAVLRYRIDFNTEQTVRDDPDRRRHLHRDHPRRPRPGT